MSRPPVIPAEYLGVVASDPPVCGDPLAGFSHRYLPDFVPPSFWPSNGSS